MQEEKCIRNIGTSEKLDSIEASLKDKIYELDGNRKKRSSHGTQRFDAFPEAAMEQVFQRTRQNFFDEHSFQFFFDDGKSVRRKRKAVLDFGRKVEDDIAKMPTIDAEFMEFSRQSKCTVHNLLHGFFRPNDFFN